MTQIADGMDDVVKLSSVSGVRFSTGLSPVRMTARSMTFSSSRILPGHGRRVIMARVSRGIVVM